MEIREGIKCFTEKEIDARAEGDFAYAEECACKVKILLQAENILNFSKYSEIRNGKLCLKGKEKENGNLCGI